MTREDTVKTIASYHKVKPSKVLRYCKTKNLDFQKWEQREHCIDYMVFPENFGEYMSIDEVAQSCGELYTYVTNKSGKGKRGTIAASIKGTRTQDIIKVLKKVSPTILSNVKEVTLDMAANMESAVSQVFPQAVLVTDRFHVVKLVIEALQHLRIDLRWKAQDDENKKVTQAKAKGERYKPERLSNGDTVKQLLTRSRHLLAKKPTKWSDSQQMRANLLFELFPKLRTAYYHTLKFRQIYTLKDKNKAKASFEDWIKDTAFLELDKFNTASNTVENHLDNIINFFDHRHTNANAESFNAKIKRFRANLRGVSDHIFFFFRIAKLFA